MTDRPAKKPSRLLHGRASARALAAACGLLILWAGVRAEEAPTDPAVPAVEMVSLSCGDVLPIDLPTALQLADTANPTIAFARAQAQEAYYRMREAQVGWLPDLRLGPVYNRHDGQLQTSRGDVLGVSKQNFFTGGGAALSWNTTNLYFGPLVARRLAAARNAAAQTVSRDVQLDVALTYLDLVRFHAALAISQDILGRAEEMLHFARAGEKAGLGKTPADINRALTEVNLRRSELIELRGQAAVVAARLAQLLLLPPAVQLVPAEPPVVPIVLVPLPACIDDLLAVALQNRPELREGRLLSEAADARFRQARISPFIPRLEIGYSGGTFGGGVNEEMDNFSGRSDGMAQAVWQLNNLGAGDVARARIQRAQREQANYHVQAVQARIGAEVTAAASSVLARQESLASSQEAVRQALEMWRRLQKATFGMAGPTRQYDPLEPLLAEQALAQARVRYLNDVIEFNRWQFRLYWALGQPPLCALPHATTLPVAVPVAPPEYQPAIPAPPKPMEEPKKP
jgi:outer membrane protein TolC